MKTNKIYIIKYLSILIILFLFISSCYNNKKKWPEIINVSENYHFISNESEKFLLTIYDINQKPLYCFDARFNAWKYDNGDYNFSGILDCRLFPVSPTNKAYSTLFQNERNATRDWQTSGRFLYSELIGLSDAPLSRSIIQRCKVRGMCIEIEVNNITSTTNQEKQIKSLDLKVIFINDLTAESDICCE